MGGLFNGRTYNYGSFTPYLAPSIIAYGSFIIDILWKFISSWYLVMSHAYVLGIKVTIFFMGADDAHIWGSSHAHTLNGSSCIGINIIFTFLHVISIVALIASERHNNNLKKGVLHQFKESQRLPWLMENITIARKDMEVFLQYAYNSTMSKNEHKWL